MLALCNVIDNCSLSDIDFARHSLTVKSDAVSIFYDQHHIDEVPRITFKKLMLYVIMYFLSGVMKHVMNWNLDDHWL